MINTNHRGHFIVISGPSGAGKGTICKELLKRNENLAFSISMTSREKRDYEEDGREYYFTTKEDFEQKIQEDYFLEHAIVHNNQYYGTPKKEVENLIEKGKNVIIEIDIQGALQIKEKVKDGLYIFILPPSMKELKKRLIKRGTESKEKIFERFKKAYTEINQVNNYNYVVVNDEIETAVKKVEAILLAENCRVDRIVSLNLDTKEELLHEILTNEGE